MQMTKMKIRHKEIEINPENPFANCKLDREQYAKVLSDIVSTFAEGFVLAINNEWGTGKTTFVKMWQQNLKNNGFQTIYFNAWENDFDNNSLVALMSELQMLTKEDDKFFKSVIEKGAIITKNVLPIVAKSLIKKYTGIKTDEVAEAFAKGTTEILIEEIKEYTTKKKTVSEFKNALEIFIKKIETNNPLVFIIDELDRCRPDYAVEVLEQIKHFFSVQGIVFVLSIDKNHLASSIKGYYGSENINTEQDTYPPLLFLLIYFKILKNQLYEGLRNKTYSLQGLCDILEDLISFANHYEDRDIVRLFIYVEALLIRFYNESKEGLNPEKHKPLFTEVIDGKQECLIKSKFKEDTEYGLNFANTLSRVITYEKSCYLGSLISKIDLMEPIHKT